MSRGLDLPEKANLWDVSKTPTIVMTQEGSSKEFQKMLTDRGVEVVEFEFLTPRRVMEYCYTRGFLQIMWECGGLLSAPAISSGVIHKASLKRNFVLECVAICNAMDLHTSQGSGEVSAEAPNLQNNSVEICSVRTGFDDLICFCDEWVNAGISIYCSQNCWGCSGANPSWRTWNGANDTSAKPF